MALYHWLSWLQEEVVQALSETLEDGRAVSDVPPD
jgi:hypothetical protein